MISEPLNEWLAARYSSTDLKVLLRSVIAAEPVAGEVEDWVAGDVDAPLGVTCPTAWLDGVPVALSRVVWTSACLQACGAKHTERTTTAARSIRAPKRVLPLGPLAGLGALAVLEPAVGIGDRFAVQDLDGVGDGT